MSWDIYAQDLPANAKKIEDIPDDFRPGPIGSRSEIIAKILAVAPAASFQPDLAWGNLEGPGYDVEINIGEEEPCCGVAFYVRGCSPLVVDVIANILESMGLRALQSGSEPFFDRTTALESFIRWQRYRDQVVNDVRDGKRPQ
jgi:hypothetical protein